LGRGLGRIREVQVQVQAASNTSCAAWERTQPQVPRLLGADAPL